MFCVGVLSISTRIQAPGIPLAFTVYYKLRKYFPVTPTFTNSGAQPEYAIGVIYTRYRTYQRHAIDGVGDRPVDNCVYARVLQSGHSFKNTFHVVEAAIEIRRAEVFGKVRINAVHAKSFALLLIDTDQQTFLFLSAVKIITRITDHRHLKIECFKLGHAVS